MPPDHDGVIDAFLRRHRGTDPEAVVRRLCRRLLAEAGATVPVDMRMLASYRGVAEVAVADQDEAGCIYYDGDRLVTTARHASPATRSRCSRVTCPTAAATPGRTGCYYSSSPNPPPTGYT
jgi:hypothetical protein